MMRTQNIYKLWAAYTLAKVVMRFIVKPHMFTHQMVRGAVRSGSFFGLIIAIVLHAISNMVQFSLYAVVNGCYLAGLYGKAHLFFSACFHIQAVIAKKYFPKPLEGPPTIDEPVARIVNLIAVLYHFGDGPIAQVALMVEYEFIWALLRFFLLALTEDGAKLLGNMRRASAAAIWQFQNGDLRFESSLIVLYPFEIFAMTFLNLLLRGRYLARGVVLGIVALFAFVAPGVIASLKPEKPEAPAEPKKKKDKAQAPEPTEAEPPKEKKE